MSGTVSTDQTFTSYTRDMETGLHYAMARYYHADLGRFITEDPAKDGRNWYVYCENNPLKYVDPSGLWHYESGEMVPDNDTEREEYLEKNAPQGGLEAFQEEGCLIKAHH